MLTYRGAQVLVGIERMMEETSRSLPATRRPAASLAPPHVANSD